jgi:hypothetical protein
MESLCRGTVFANVEFAGATGLDKVEHSGVSHMTVSTVARSNGRISRTFLHRCGVPERLSAQRPREYRGGERVGP